MNERVGELKKNTFLIAIATIGSRAISFILAPLYSFYLTTEQYGMMDLIATTCSLIGPFICLDIYESTFRFTKDDKFNNKKVITTSLIICLLMMVVCLFALGGYSLIKPLTTSIVICAFSAMIDSLNNTVSQYARGKDEISVFAFSGILSSIAVFGLNILFLIALKMELTGWMISFILSKIIVLLYLIVKLKLWNDIYFDLFDKKFLKEGLMFSLPLMPSASMWWIMNASDRYILNEYWGIAATGIYAAAIKLPSILSVLESVFYQAWQTTAIDTLQEKERDNFYSNIFLNYFRLLSIGVVGILLILKPLFLTLFAKDYSSGWECAAILVVGVMIHALGGNIGVLYTVFKGTKGALKTSFIGAVVNIILNLIFVPRFGMIAAACTTFISYIFVLGVRWFDIKKYVKINFIIKRELLTVIFILCSFILYYVPGNMSYGIRSVMFLYCLYINKEIIATVMR